MQLVSLFFLVAVLGGVLVGDAFDTDIRVLYHCREIRDPDPLVRKRAADALLGLGASGRDALERIAFSRRIAEPGAAETATRQTALDALLSRDFVFGGNRHNEPLVVRFIREARGLERLAVYDSFEWTECSTTEPLVEAASEAILTDPAPGVASACFYLWRVREKEGVRQTLHRAVRESVNVDARIAIITGILSADRRDDERRILRALLADEDERIRVAAAAVLAGTFLDSAGWPVLVAYLRQPLGRPFDHCHWLQLEEQVWRAFCTLPDEHVVWALGRARARVPGFFVGPVLDFPGCPPLDERAWELWWAEHKAEYPAQVDPDTLPVAPVTSWARTR